MRRWSVEVFFALFLACTVGSLWLIISSARLSQTSSLWMLIPLLAGLVFFVLSLIAAQIRQKALYKRPGT